MDREEYRAIRKELAESSAGDEMKVLYMLAGATETMSRAIFARLRGIYARHGYTVRNDMLKGLNDYCRAVRQATFLYCDRVDSHIIEATWGAAGKAGGDGTGLYDDFCRDANSVVRLMTLVIDRCARDDAAFSKVVDTLLALPSKGIFGDGDIRRYTLK